MKKEIKSKLLQIRIAPEDKLRLEELASKSDMDVSRYIRHFISLGYVYKIEVNVPADIVRADSIHVQRMEDQGNPKLRKHATG